MLQDRIKSRFFLLKVKIIYKQRSVSLYVFQTLGQSNIPTVINCTVLSVSIDYQILFFFLNQSNFFCIYRKIIFYRCSLIDGHECFGKKNNAVF